jgi:hypothetical protein
MIADSAIMGYTCIIFMLRRVVDPVAQSQKPVSSDADITDSLHAYNASRHIIDFINVLLTRFASLGTMSTVFCLYQCHVPFAYLATNARNSDDVDLLDQVADNIAKVTKDESDFLPLSQALLVCLEISKIIKNSSR